MASAIQHSSSTCAACPIGNSLEYSTSGVESQADIGTELIDSAELDHQLSSIDNYEFNVGRIPHPIFNRNNNMIFMRYLLQNQIMSLFTPFEFDTDADFSLSLPHLISVSMMTFSPNQVEELFHKIFFRTLLNTRFLPLEFQTLEMHWKSTTSDQKISIDLTTKEYLRNHPVIERTTRAIIRKLQDHLYLNLEDYDFKVMMTQDPECDQPDVRIIVSTAKLDFQEMFDIWDVLSDIALKTVQMIGESLKLGNEEIEELLDIITVSIQPKRFSDE